MVPDEGDRYEIRVKGPNILPHYFRAPDKTAEAFDDEGFFLTGDAMTLADAENPDRGLKFAGRIAEDFKLATGIWVRATDLRLELLGALKPLALDVVITGDMRNEVGVLIFPAPATVAGLQDTAGFAVNAELMQDIADRLRPFSDPGRGSANRVVRAAILTEPPSMAEGEVTAKGNLNFRKVQLRRQALVQKLYDAPGCSGLITFE
jgi:feruloyl-CoA synthase